MFESVICGGTCSKVGLMQDQHARICDASQIIHRPVDRAIVDNHKPEAAKRLLQHRLYRARQIRHAIVDSHQHGHVSHFSSIPFLVPRQAGMAFTIVEKSTIVESQKASD